MAIEVTISQVTGSAQFRKLRTVLLVDQAQLHQEMQQMVGAARLNGCPLWLQLHVAKSADAPSDSLGQWRLRWRMSVVGGFKHVLWGDVQEIVRGLPMAITKHLTQMQRRVAEVNLLDALLQGQISKIERFLGMRGVASATPAQVELLVV